MDLLFEHLGVLPHQIVAESRRWGGIPDVLPDEPPIRTLEEALGLIEIIQNDATMEREQYLFIAQEIDRHLGKYKVHLQLDDDGFDTDLYLALIRGKLWFPWVDEQFSEALTNPQTFVQVGQEKWYLTNLETFYRGRDPVWLRLTISSKEACDGL